MMDFSDYAMNDQNSPAPNEVMTPQWQDRITAALGQAAAQKQQQMPSNVPPNIGVTPDQMYNPALLASMQQQQQAPQQDPVAVIKQAADAGHPASQSLYKSAALFSNDPNTQDMLIRAVVDHPNEVDPNNSYQVKTVMAQAAKQSGAIQQEIQSQGQSQQTMPQQFSPQQSQFPPMPNIQQISMQDLGNIVSGKGTNFLGLQQAAAKDISDLQFKQAQENRFNAMAAGIGKTPAALQLANAYEDAINRGDTQRANDILVLSKSLNKDETKDVNGNIINAPGALNTAFQIENAKEGGKQNAILGTAGQIEAEKERGKNLQTAKENEQTTNNKADLMIANSNDMISKATQLLANHPILGNSSALLNTAAWGQAINPKSKKDIIDTVTSLEQLGSANLLPSIKEYLQGTGQVRVFEGVNLDKIFSYDDTKPLSSNITKWNNAIQQVQMGAAGAKALRESIESGSIVPTGVNANSSSNLTPAEQAEMQALKAKYGR